MNATGPGPSQATTWLLRLRLAAGRAWPGISSWRLSVLLMVSGSLYVALLAIWAISSPAQVVANISGLLPYWIVWGGLLINMIACFWRRLPRLRRDLSREPVLAVGMPSLVLELAPDEVEETRRLLERRGVRFGSDSNHGIRRRWSALGSYLFHGSLAVLLLGAAMTWLGRSETRMRLAEGETWEGRPDQVLSASKLPADLPSFAVDDIDIEFWGNQMLFTDFEAALDFDEESEQVRINSPIRIGCCRFLRLTGFGHAPVYELRNDQGQLMEGAVVKLSVFPPGERDLFMLDHVPHRVHVRLFPNWVDNDGQPATDGVAMDRPRLEVLVSRGRLEVGSALLAPGESMHFEGLELSFPEILGWVELAAVWDPGAPVLMLGFILGIFGLAMKLAGDRAEVVFRLPDTEGGATVLEIYGEMPRLPEPHA